MQSELDSLAERIIDLEEQIELAGDEDKYIPRRGTEYLIHASIIRGRRFDENTGKEVSEPYVQTFTYPEFLNFKKNAERVGYVIEKVLYNPYNNK